MADDSSSCLRQYLLNHGPQLITNFKAKPTVMEDKFQEMASKPKIGGASAQGLVYLDDLEQKAAKILLNKCRDVSCTIATAAAALQRDKVLSQYLFANRNTDGIMSFVLRHPNTFFVWGDRVYATSGGCCAPTCPEYKKLKEFVAVQRKIALKGEKEYYQSTKFAKHIHRDFLNVKDLNYYDPKTQREISLALSIAYVESVVQQQATESCSTSTLLNKIRKASVQIFYTVFPKTCSIKDVEEFLENHCKPCVTIKAGQVLVTRNAAWDRLCTKAVQAQLESELQDVVDEEAEYANNHGNLTDNENTISDEPDEAADGEWETAGKKIHQLKNSLSTQVSQNAKNNPGAKIHSTRNRRKRKQSKPTTMSSVTPQSPGKSPAVVPKKPEKDKNPIPAVPGQRPSTPGPTIKNGPKLATATKSRDIPSPAPRKTSLPTQEGTKKKKKAKTVLGTKSRPQTPNLVTNERRMSISRDPIFVMSPQPVVTKKTVLAPWAKPENSAKIKQVPLDCKSKHAPKGSIFTQNPNMSIDSLSTRTNSHKHHDPNVKGSVDASPPVIGKQERSNVQGQKDLTPKPIINVFPSRFSPSFEPNHEELSLNFSDNKSRFEMKQSGNGQKHTFTQMENRVSNTTALDAPNWQQFPLQSVASISPSMSVSVSTKNIASAVPNQLRSEDKAVIFNQNVVNIPTAQYQAPTMLTASVGNFNTFISPLYAQPPSLFGSRFIPQSLQIPFVVQQQQNTLQRPATYRFSNLNQVQQRTTVDSIVAQAPNRGQQQFTESNNDLKPTTNRFLYIDNNTTRPFSARLPITNQQTLCTQMNTQQQSKIMESLQQKQQQQQTQRQSYEGLQLAKQLQEKQHRKPQEHKQDRILQPHEEQQERRRQAFITQQEQPEMQHTQNLVLQERKEEQNQQQLNVQQLKQETGREQPLAHEISQIEFKYPKTREEKQQQCLNIALTKVQQLRLKEKQQAEMEKMEQTKVTQLDKENGAKHKKRQQLPDKEPCNTETRSQPEHASQNISAMQQNLTAEKEVELLLTKEKEVNKTKAPKTSEKALALKLPRQNSVTSEIFINPHVKLIKEELQQQEDQTLHINVLFIKCLDVSDGRKFESVNDLNNFINNFANMFSSNGGLVQIQA